jgi:hypothetical protein
MPVHDLDEEESPLDPAAERLRRKLARLLLVSGAIMVLGFIAVFAAIVYRLGGFAQGGPDAAEAPPGAAPFEASLPMPAGARLMSADLDGNRVLLTVQAADGAVSLLLLELPSGRIIGRYTIRPQ